MLLPAGQREARGMRYRSSASKVLNMAGAKAGAAKGLAA